MTYSEDKHFELQRMGQRTGRLEQGQNRGKEALCAILNDVQHCIYHTTRQNLDMIGNEDLCPLKPLPSARVDFERFPSAMLARLPHN